MGQGRRLSSDPRTGSRLIAAANVHTAAMMTDTSATAEPIGWCGHRVAKTPIATRRTPNQRRAASESPGGTRAHAACAVLRPHSDQGDNSKPREHDGRRDADRFDGQLVRDPVAEDHGRNIG
jgi:hypothetical protein